MADARKARTQRMGSLKGSGPESSRGAEQAPAAKLPAELAGLREGIPRASAKDTGIEILIVHGAEHNPKKPWRAAEVWTKNRVYGLDSAMCCFEVIDRVSGKPDPAHSMLQSRLGGGRLRTTENVRFAYPFPLPGMEAMFTQGKKYGYTSMVERFVVRIRVLNTDADDHPPTWEEIAGRWQGVKSSKR